MHTFDQGYMERREKRIQEMFILRAISRTMALISVVLLLALFLVTNRGDIFTFVIGTSVLGTGLAAIITYVIGRGEFKAGKKN